jgi:hypothetical protein
MGAPATVVVPWFADRYDDGASNQEVAGSRVHNSRRYRRPYRLALSRSARRGIEARWRAGPQPDLCHRPAVADRRARLKYHRTREALEQQTATAEGAAGHRPSRNAALSDGESWVACRPGYFLPVTVLSQMFRGLFLHYLGKASAAGELNFFTAHRHLHVILENYLARRSSPCGRRLGVSATRSMSGHPQNVRLSGGDDAKPDGMIVGTRRRTSARQRRRRLARPVPGYRSQIARHLMFKMTLSRVTF